MKRGRRWEKSGDPTGMVTDMIFCLVFQAGTLDLVTEYAVPEVSDHYKLFIHFFCADIVLVTILWPKQFQLNVYVLFLRREFPQGENTMQKLFL